MRSDKRHAFSLRLQPAQPYDRHLGWALSRRAYAADGPASWRSGKVPQGISANPAFAAQQARLLWQALDHKQALDRSLRVLELGGGTGSFAWHFIQAFEQLTREQGADLKLTYLLSDPVAANLAGLASNPHFEPLISDGRLVLAQADLLAPGRLRDLWGQPLQIDVLDMITISYVLCHQPFRALQQSGAGCREYLVTTVWELELPDWARALHPQLTGALRDLGHLPTASELEALLPQQALPQLTPERYKELTDILYAQSWPEQLQLSSEASETAWAQACEQGKCPDWLSEALEAWPGACLLVPEQALMGLQGWIEHLAPQSGLLLISDKGWADAEGFRKPPLPSCHGAHLAWPVHFPLLATWARHAGLSALHSDNLLWPMHSLLAVKGALDPGLAAHFEDAWNQRNVNFWAAELVDSAVAAEAEDDSRKAAMLYLQALEHRPGDARLVHELVACLIELQAFTLAEAHLEQPCHDLFGEYDFSFQRGQLHLFGGSPTAAIEAFETSLRDFGPDPASYYNLGLSQMLANRHQAARASFAAALALDPEHGLAQAALASWNETFRP